MTLDRLPIEKSLIITLLTLVQACDSEQFKRSYCSDEPVCFKYECEEGFNSSCEKWEDYCSENPTNKDCSKPVRRR